MIIKLKRLIDGGKTALHLVVGSLIFINILNGYNNSNDLPCLMETMKKKKTFYLSLKEICKQSGDSFLCRSQLSFS